jgi:hypothetical protein
MSLVMTFATEDFAVISGDFRRTHIKSDDIYFDDTPKVFKLNSNVLGGFSGDCDVTHYLLQELKELSDKATVEATARFIRRRLKGDIQQSVILTGLSDSGKITIMEVSHHHNFKPVKVRINPGEIKWHYAFPYVDPGEYIEEQFGQLTECNRETIAALANQVNVKCSESDVRVSENCSVLSIARG